MVTKFRSNAKRVKRDIRAGTRENLEAGTEILTSAVRAALLRGEPRTGIEYRIPGAIRATYTASAPGEMPANRTGTLANSYQHVPEGDFSRLAGSPLVYAYYLEKRKNRPHFGPVYKRKRRQIEKRINRRVV